MNSIKTALVGFILSMLVVPAFALAQSSEIDLRAAIQASILNDPRVQTIPPTHLNALIDALVAEATAQHMQASDILWQPQRAAAASAVETQTSKAN